MLNERSNEDIQVLDMKHVDWQERDYFGIQNQLPSVYQVKRHSQGDLDYHNDSIITMLDKRQQRSKRQLIRDTKNIKVNFGSIKANLLGPRMAAQGEKSKKINLKEMEREVYE